MSKVTFNTEIAFEYCKAKPVAPSIRRMVACNPSSLTFKGTNTYIVGQNDVVIVDPGPDLLEHYEALLHELKNERITHILLTHTHYDHSSGLEKLKVATNAITLGFGARDQGLRNQSISKPSGKSFIDWDFVPDQEFKDGDILGGDGWQIEAIHTPGHAPDHLCFALTEQNLIYLETM